jgi:hypothetical protein
VRVMSALPQHRVARICERLEHLQCQILRSKDSNHNIFPESRAGHGAECGGLEKK